MLIHFDRLAVASLSTLNLTRRADNTAICFWHSDCFKSPANDTYALTQCGGSNQIDPMRDIFVKQCNATIVPDEDTNFWRTVENWPTFFLFRKEWNANDTAFVACLESAYQNNAPKPPGPPNAASHGLGISAAAALLSAAAFAFGLG